MSRTLQVNPEPAMVLPTNEQLMVPLDVSFRVISDYLVGVDGFVTRLDVLYQGEQYNVMIAGNPEIGPKGEDPIRDGKDLFLPEQLAQRNWATRSRVNAQQLAQAFRGLADVLDPPVTT